jgi:hypothetical protein
LSTLEQVAAFKTIPDADDLDVFDVSDHEAAAVAVYDFGQRSLSAIVNEVEHPVIFFDMGWPLSFFPKSLPKHLRFFNPFPTALGGVRRPHQLFYRIWTGIIGHMC